MTYWQHHLFLFAIHFLTAPHISKTHLYWPAASSMSKACKKDQPASHLDIFYKINLTRRHLACKIPLRRMKHRFLWFVWHGPVSQFVWFALCIQFAVSMYHSPSKKRINYRDDLSEKPDFAFNESKRNKLIVCLNKNLGSKLFIVSSVLFFIISFISLKLSEAVMNKVNGRKLKDAFLLCILKRTNEKHWWAPECLWKYTALISIFFNQSLWDTNGDARL